jgi:nucleoside-diphosphate-sugar epimerase
MSVYLVTGGSGFFGSILKKRIVENGDTYVNVDLVADAEPHPGCTSKILDIRNEEALRAVFRENKFAAVFHCAAVLAHDTVDTEFLWSSNVEGTRVLAELVAEFGVPKIVFISSNCLWGRGFGRPVLETDAPEPVEIYGRSKWEAEKILSSYSSSFPTVIFRCPTIIDEGRLGLLSILFEFIDEGKTVWTVGGGKNCYQFIYAQDLASACLKAAKQESAGVFNIGSNDVKTFREVYEFVIEKAGTGARVGALPKRLTLWAMKAAYVLRLSPLGPYQYKMIAEDFVFDTTKIKTVLGWSPTLTNEQMLWKAYEYYHSHRQEIQGRTGVSAHKRVVKMGIIRVLKWIS